MAAEAEATREARAKVTIIVCFVIKDGHCNAMHCWPNQALNLITPINDNLQVIAAEGEQKASRALKEASDIISESPAALQLRS